MCRFNNIHRYSWVNYTWRWTAERNLRIKIATFHEQKLLLVYSTFMAIRDDILWYSTRKKTEHCMMSTFLILSIRDINSIIITSADERRVGGAEISDIRPYVPRHAIIDDVSISCKHFDWTFPLVTGWRQSVLSWVTRLHYRHVTGIIHSFHPPLALSN